MVINPIFELLLLSTVCCFTLQILLFLQKLRHPDKWEGKDDRPARSTRE